MGIALLGLLTAIFIYKRILSLPEGSEKVQEIAAAIKEGAMAFLKGEYKVIVVYAIVVSALLTGLGFASDYFSKASGLVFLLGATLSALAGNIGMRTATSSSSRTVWAVKDDMKKGLKIAFSSGAVMGLSVVSLGLLGVSIVYYFLRSPDVLFSFGFGASSIALFARVGGGIYTKSADVGADLVGKVEKGIPEDDPRNPAVIADNVGDNVGDVAGMGADLFESYVDSIIAAIAVGVIGITVGGRDLAFGGITGLAAMLPLVLAALGIVSALIGILFVGRGRGEDPHSELNRGIFGASLIFAVLALLAIYYLMGFSYVGLYWCVLSGLIAGIIIGLITEYYTSDKYQPTRKLAEASKTGAATNIIEGLALGMLSTVVPVITVSAAIIVAYYFAGLYGIALAAVGMLSTLGITLATDSYGPVADNAAGLAEMASLGKRTRERAEALDAVGNTTAAIGKGFAIGSAALTALALFTTYTTAAHLSLSSFSLSRPDVIVGLFIGGLLPFLFSSMTMQAVGKTAMAMVEEVRRQFRTIKGLMSGKAKPDYARCVEISTKAALKEMIDPSLTAILTPVLVGFLLGPEALGGLLAGSIVTGFVLAIMMANSGGAWDNAKKYIEKGNLGGKGSAPHKAAVVGDTVGDPFKDTSGPSLNILIKLMSIVALVFAPFF
ncbi:MAG: sodium-translocating pyrophosphatase [Thermoplasmata archaeon]|nr:sodium-translocating pyrophosphatase [Thermoplasmata archaeon]